MFHVVIHMFPLLFSWRLKYKPCTCEDHNGRILGHSNIMCVKVFGWNPHKEHSRLIGFFPWQRLALVGSLSLMALHNHRLSLSGNQLDHIKFHNSQDAKSEEDLPLSVEASPSLTAKKYASLIEKHPFLWGIKMIESSTLPAVMGMEVILSWSMGQNNCWITSKFEEFVCWSIKSKTINFGRESLLLVNVLN